MSGLSIDKEIYKILKNDDKIKELVGDEIYPIVRNKEKIDKPFIIYQKDNVVPTTVKGMVACDEVTIGFLIVYKNLDITIDIAERIRQLFELRYDDYFYRVDLNETAEYYENDCYCQEITFKCLVKK